MNMKNNWPQDYIDYLKWRCKTNWPSKYLKSNWYIDTWISGVTDKQMDYFINKERRHLINSGKYKI